MHPQGSSRVVAVLINETGDDLVDFLELLFVRRFCRCRDFDDIFQVCEQLFLNGFSEPLINYLDNVEAYCNKIKLRDPLTGEEMNPDEKLMRSIEEQIGISENAKKAFREEILIRIFQVCEQLFLNGFSEPLMRIIVKPFPFSCIGRNANENFFAECLFRIFGNAEKKEVQKAFVYSYEESAKTLMDNYLDNVEAYCNKVQITLAVFCRNRWMLAKPFF